MNMNIGIDSVDIDRFSQFGKYAPRQLRRVYSTDEIAHCLAIPKKSAERFAARFAYKEALYKALTHRQGRPPCTLFSFFTHVSLSRDAIPRPIIDWGALGLLPQKIILSFTHTKHAATAVIIVYGERMGDLTAPEIGLY
ncbi:MAG: 4'-phosphopantetheinyl transferase superfamily protein [Candidatus Dependentiae bacterium]|nr:4'-phosphopantetheinyl transferase superfamily protein [Candidatus Dependentiae bacterium]